MLETNNGLECGKIEVKGEEGWKIEMKFNLMIR